MAPGMASDRLCGAYARQSESRGGERAGGQFFQVSKERESRGLTLPPITGGFRKMEGVSGCEYVVMSLLVCLIGRNPGKSP